jgi:protein-L-isoaspartate(D-aspartate) O-methyltransferase
MMTIEKNRFNMIEQQIRPWNVSDQDVLNALIVVKREKFFPESQQGLAFFDTELPLPDGSFSLAPKIEARILQELNVKKQESVLVIGAGTGYLPALLGYKARSVLVTEVSAELKELAEKNLRENDVQNVRVVSADGLNTKLDERFDVIVVSGSLEIVPEQLQQQLTIGGRLFVVAGKAPVMYAQITTRETETQFATKTSFETVVAPLPQAVAASKFTF